jgi:hypothetical protein
MKATLEFDLDCPEDRLQHKKAVDAADLSIFLWDLEQDLFRTARKHGYPDSVIGRRLNELLEQDGAVSEAISLLEYLYFEKKAGRFDYE